MNKARYYFGWFKGIVPNKIIESLKEDLTTTHSLAIITTAPSDATYTDNMLAFTKDTWFEPAGLVFDAYHSIDHRVSKEEAHRLIEGASAILLHGGYPTQLQDFLIEYDLATAIDNSQATVIMGASAGGMNMCAKFPYGKYIDDQTREPAVIYKGLGYDNFALQSHAIGELESIMKQNHVQQYLLPLSDELDTYIACEESTLRVRNAQMDIMGQVYRLSKRHASQMAETI